MQKTLLSFQKYLDEFYEKRCVEINNAHIIETIENFLKELVEKNDFCILMSEQALDSWKKDNRYKTQVETNIGTTMGGKEARVEITKQLFNCDTQNLLNSDYPKYAMLCGKDKELQFMLDSDPLFRYGNAVVTLKKENLLERTTMTLGSSTSFMAGFEYKRPCFVQAPKVSCLPGTNYQAKNKIEFDSKNIATIFYKAIQAEVMKVTNPASLIRVFEGTDGFEIFELQIHGELLFDTDVEKVEIF